MSHSHHEPHVEHGGEHGNNKKVAILISVLAALLAIVETAGKNAQTLYLSHQVEASNLWAFYQAKTIRRTAVLVQLDRLQLDRALNPEVAGQAADERQAAWRGDVDRWESEPETGEGRRELMARAQQQERLRDASSQRYHRFEYGSAALQLAIVLASASIVTGMMILAWGAVGLGGLGTAFALWGWLGIAVT